MLLLLGFAFVAGVVTILSPCILPVLPIVLSSTVDSSGVKRPLGVVTGFVVSFTFFTLFLSTIVRWTGLPADSLRMLSILILVIFGLTMVISSVQQRLEQVLSSLSRFAPRSAGFGFGGGLLIGLSLGLLWTPCVGPILASVISLSIAGTVSTQAGLITLAYALGTAVPMFAVMYGGNQAVSRTRWLRENAVNIQKIFGVLMILTAVGIYFNIDRRFQSWILTTFPNYGTGLTKIEDTPEVRESLKSISPDQVDNRLIGKTTADMLPVGVDTPELILGGEWINSAPLKLSELRGKVVVIDFWTYSCINCQRTLPYLKNWWQKYKDQGLVIIGVHSPEFEFEKNITNVKQAVADFGITYPVMQDNNFATWRAFNNIYWPAKYFVDRKGMTRFTHFGEGAYDESEKVIRQLLAETGVALPEMAANPEYQIFSRTPETYLGFARITGFASNEQMVRGKTVDYTLPEVLPPNGVALEGRWLVDDEFATPDRGGSLELNFDAREVFLVMRPKNGAVTARVLVDDEVQYPGGDVVNGQVTVDADRLYRLVKLDSPGRHTLRLEFAGDGVEVYAFTFG